MGQSVPNSDSGAAELIRLGRQAQDLVQAALDPRTRKCYERTWRQFNDFCKTFKIKSSLPVGQSVLLLYISYLFDKNYASSTICSAISALVYFHFEKGLPDPRTKQVYQALAGVKNKRPSVSSWQPLSLENVNILIRNAQGAFSSSFTVHLFKAMACLAFYALLRVGEFTYSQHSIRRADISIHKSYVEIRFQSFKHSGGIGVTQSVSAIHQKDVCPVHLLAKYLSVSGHKNGLLFVKEDGMAPSRKEFLDWLKTVMVFCGLDDSRFNTHSFRAGMATHMALNGFSAEQIKLAGRWSSDAYRKYIRVVKV